MVNFRQNCSKAKLTVLTWKLEMVSLSLGMGLCIFSF